MDPKLLLHALRCVRLILFLLFIVRASFLPVQHSSAQVHIKEKIQITPEAVQAVVPGAVGQQAAEASQPLLLHSGGLAVSATVPNIVVSGSVSVSAPDSPHNTSMVFTISIGSTRHTRMLERNCSDEDVSNLATIPATSIEGCGSISVTAIAFHWSGWFCGHSFSMIDQAQVTVSGSTALYTFTETFYNWRLRKFVTAVATVTLTASAGTGSSPGSIEVTPASSELTCSGSTTLNVRALREDSTLFAGCISQPLVATATLSAKGPYAYLESGSDRGTSVSVPLSGGAGSFRVVLDTSKGVIPRGFDPGRVEVSLFGATGSASVAFRCPYPPPAVTLTYPAQDTTIVLTHDNQPILTLQEVHSPSSGQFEPSISWEPSQTIDTRVYYKQMQSGDTVEIAVTVTATNVPQMQAQDRKKIRLVKGGCEDARPCPPVLPVTPPITIVTHPNGFAGLNVCEKPTTLGGFAVVTGRQMIAPYEIEACFDRSTNRWKFAVPQGIQINAVQDLCYENIQRNGQELVSEMTQIPKAECSRALEDFRLNYDYPPGQSAGRVPKYLVAQALLWHEEAHKGFERRLLSESSGIWEKEFAQYQPTCAEVSTLDAVLGAARSKIGDALTKVWSDVENEFKRRAYDRERYQQGDPREAGRKLAHERTIHSDILVRLFIREYIEQLERYCSQ